MLAFLSLGLALQTPDIAVTNAIVIGGVARAGRRPVPDDAIVREIVSGTWRPPSVGGTVTFNGETRTWHLIQANKDGWLENAALDNGYAYVHIDSPTTRTVLMRAQGDGLVYVNGSLRPGDPYATGNLQLPVELRQGGNDLLFVAGRGRLKVDLLNMDPPIRLQSEDATLPDVLTTDTQPLMASVIALNGTSQPVDLHVVATCKGASASGPVSRVIAMSARKIEFRVPVPINPQPGPLSVDLALWQENKELEVRTLTVSVKRPLDHFKRTFVSGIDGSVQYYAVDPAAKPSNSNALVLTVHGASVEATGQAAAYAQKDWATVVAATNRRPYGFDWEDIGREDALEVLADAEKTFPHDPAKVDLTGHSMGGHGTWSIGTLYPGLFASIAPSAGWISFWSYAGGWNPEQGLDTEKILRRSMNVSDTMGRVTNTLGDRVYILHGDADDNVPVEQARTMRAALEKIGHPALQYHEQPGAGHWWGNQCVDWPPIFQMIQDSRIDPDPMTIDFTTQNPDVSDHEAWVRIDQQVECLSPSRVQAKRNPEGTEYELTTSNVAALQLDGVKPGARVAIDGQAFTMPEQNRNRVRGFARSGVGWGPFDVSRSNWEKEKNPSRGGPFKSVYANRFLFVIGTNGSAEENQWASDRARFDSETMLYKGNGSVDVITDREYNPRRYRDRNVILYGNADTNRAWAEVLGNCPVQVREGSAYAGATFPLQNLGGLIVYPAKGSNALAGAVCGTGIEGMRLTDRLGLFTSGIAYPDWILFEQDAPAGIRADGFFDNHWRLDPQQSAGVPPFTGPRG